MCENSNHSKNFPLFGAIIPYSNWTYAILFGIKYSGIYPVKLIFQEITENSTNTAVCLRVCTVHQ